METPTPDCAVSPPPCDIYTALYWELRYEYLRFEIGRGVYPYHPLCLEAWERGEPIVCATVLVFLRPDGSLGMSWDGPY